MPEPTAAAMSARDGATISEYTAVAHAFFVGKEPGLANGVLDRLGRTLRAAEM